MKKNTKIISLLFIYSIIQFSCAEESDDPDTPVTLCDNVGGVCTGSPSYVCEPGYEPYTTDDPRNTDCDGQCCVQAPDSPCTAEENVNCVPGDVCEDNWREVEGNLYCEDGRVCCYWSD